MKTEEFKFENGLSVRIPLVENETSWFIASDVCEILGLVDTRRAVERLDEDERKKEKIASGGQLREFWLINEFGLYQLILSSEKPEAKLFKRWITHKVLPALRMNGKYTQEQANNRETIIQRKIREIEGFETSIKDTKNTLNDFTKKLIQSQVDLKLILKADISQMEMDFSANEGK